MFIFGKTRKQSVSVIYVSAPPSLTEREMADSGYVSKVIETDIWYSE